MAKAETTIKGIIETAIAEHHNVNIAFACSTLLKNWKHNFTVRVNDEFVVEYGRYKGFTVFSFRSGMEGVYNASFSSRGNIGKVSLNTFYSEGLTERYTPDTLMKALAA